MSLTLLSGVHYIMIMLDVRKGNDLQTFDISDNQLAYMSGAYINSDCHVLIGDTLVVVAFLL